MLLSEPRLFDLDFQLIADFGLSIVALSALFLISLFFIALIKFLIKIIREK